MIDDRAQVGFVYLDLRKFPMEETIDQWFPVLVVKKLLYKTTKPELHLHIYKTSQTVRAEVAEAAQLVSMQPTYEEMMKAIEKEKAAQRLEAQKNQVSATMMFVTVSSEYS